MTRAGLACLVLLGLAVVSVVLAADPPAPAASAAAKDQAALEKQFEDLLSGATLEGYFTTVEKDDGKTHSKEKYTLGKVSKLQDGVWKFECRIQYGDHDATLPLALPVKWAGDTPVITLTDLPIPGFGSFTCRVLIYGDRYVGTWQGQDHGGHMFGRVIKARSS